MTTPAGKAGPIALVPNASRLPDSSIPPVDWDVMEPPAVLTEDEATYWRFWAPLATRNGMLTPERLPGFVLLCQQAVLAATMRAGIASEGMLVQDYFTDSSGTEHRRIQANPLLTRYQTAMLRVEQLQARFGLTGDGKVPEVEAEPDAERTQLARLMSIR